MGSGASEGPGGPADPSREPPPESRGEGRRRTLIFLSAVIVLLLLLPLAVSLGVFGGDDDALVVGFLPFQAPPGEADLDRTATTLLEGVHGRFRDASNPYLSLVGPTVTQQFRDSREMPEELGRRIGADVVVVGGLRPESDGTALLSVALIRAEDGRSLWTGELDLPRPPTAADRTRVLDWLHSRLRRALQAARVPSAAPPTSQ